MTAHLLIFSIGPVAEFVKASRRTRDIHFSSHLVAEMARASADAVAKEGGELVVPASADRGNPVSDRVLAKLKSGAEPSRIAEQAKAAAKEVWARKIREVKSGLAGISINEDIWNAQASSDLIEFFAAWVPWDETPDSYSMARERAEILLNARENLTDFARNAIGARVPKSSLDGRRESVLVRHDDKNQREAEERRRATKGIRPGEALDLPGLVKRLGSDAAVRFPSVSRIAVEPWIRGAKHNTGRKSALTEISKIAAGAGDTLPFQRMNALLDARYGDFPYDGQLLFRSRIKSLKKDYPGQESPLGEIERKLEGVREPFPYLAIVSCDGDNMSGRVKGMSLAEHKHFSAKLSEFSLESRNIVEEQHFGSLIYAGGDDVLAFLPLHTALPCCQKLKDAFKSRLKDIGAGEPSLSVGIAIVHMLTPMAGDMVRLAHEGELAAKRGNLAVHLYKRAGTPVKFVQTWNAEPVRNLLTWMEWLKKEYLSDRAVYDLMNLARDFREPKTGEALRWVDQDLVEKESVRLLDKKKIPPEMLPGIREEFKVFFSSIEDLEKMASGLIVARAILSAQLDAEGR